MTECDSSSPSSWVEVAVTENLYQPFTSVAGDVQHAQLEESDIMKSCLLDWIWGPGENILEAKKKVSPKSVFVSCSFN